MKVAYVLYQIADVVMFSDVHPFDISCKVYKNDFGTLTFLAESLGVMSGEFAIPLKVTSPGNILLEVHCFDSLGNFSIAQRQIIVDEAAFRARFTGIPEKPA